MEADYAHGIACLAARDAHLARVIERHGAPALRTREPGFATLVYIILEQQVSLASARATYDKLLTKVKPLTPRRFLKLDKRTLRRVGFSRQKIVYARLLAEEIAGRKLDLRALDELDDDAVRARLTALKGIGPWTAENYLLMALRRADVWPAHDLALQIAVHEVKELRKRPTPETLEKISEAWRPWRSVATRIFWHHYLSTPRGRERKKQIPRRPDQRRRDSSE